MPTVGQELARLRQAARDRDERSHHLRTGAVQASTQRSLVGDLREDPIHVTREIHDLPKRLRDPVQHLACPPTERTDPGEPRTRGQLGAGPFRRLGNPGVVCCHELETTHEIGADNAGPETKKTRFEHEAFDTRRGSDRYRHPDGGDANGARKKAFRARPKLRLDTLVELRKNAAPLATKVTRHDAEPVRLSRSLKTE